MNARVLSTEAGATAHERLGGYLSESERERACAAADTALLVVDAPGPAAVAVARALRAAGAYAHADDARLVVSGTRAALDAASARLTGDARTLAAELVRAFAADRERPHAVRIRGQSIDFRERAQVMGILNVTPDSFHDGGRYNGVDRARARAAEMVALGADIIDIGGHSYANGNPRIGAGEERDRVVPVVQALVRDGIGVPLSIDTFKATVAEAALDAGAGLINDCSGLSDDALAGVVARYDAALVVMHLKGELNVRSPEYRYDDAMGEILGFLRDRTDRALAAGVKADAIVVDPGLEFGKELETDLEILERFGDLRSLGYPILFAASRKSFIGRVFDRPAAELLVPSLATAALGIAAGAGILRVHDIEETVQFARMLGAVRFDRYRALDLAASVAGEPPGATRKSLG